jgi:hypothetical protein
MPPRFLVAWALLFASKLAEVSGGVEARLPRLAADDHDASSATLARVVADHIHVGRDGVISSAVLRVELVRTESHVVDREVAVELQ